MGEIGAKETDIEDRKGLEGDDTLWLLLTEEKGRKEKKKKNK